MRTKAERYTWILLFAMVFLSTDCREKQVYSGNLPPIFLITLDTTRRDFLAPYNSDVTTTPALLEFSRTATTFDQAYATAPWTLPTHASMFTGLFPSKHGAGVSETKLPENLQSITQILKEKGYQAAGFSGGPFTSSRYGFHRGFDVFRDHQKPFTRASDSFSRTKDFLAENSDKPSFVFLNLFDAHAPYHPPGTYQNQFDLASKRRRVEALPRWRESFGGYGLLVRKLVKMGEPEPEVKEYLHAAYASEIAYVDKELGVFFNWLRKKDLFDKALIIVLADHGEYLGENGRYFHSYTLDPVLTHIPLMVKWPNQKLGERNPGLASQVDVFGTILKAANCEIPPNDGTPLDEISPGQDRWVLLEEHRLEPIHPLTHKEFLLAESVFGIQTATVRGIVWEGHNQCERLTNLTWQPVDCGHDWQEDLAFIRQHIRAKEPKAAEKMKLDQAEQEVLRSLGYIQ